MSTKKWKNVDALVTEFDEYQIELMAVINQRAKYTKRAENKPMASIENPENPHVTSREEHMRQAASEALKIAKGLGLNEVVTYIGMLMHDAGQPFGAHDGEKTIDIIQQINNLGFYHHNAKGVNVVLSEDIIQKFVDAIPEAKNNPELQQKLKDQAWYFLEIIVGHDGESTSKDNNKYSMTDKKYKSIKEAVLAKVSNANRTNQYKCSVETLEAQISKPADVLSYLKSDILTGFSEQILKNLSDDYLELIGELLAETNEETSKIEFDIENASNNKEKEMLEKKARKDRIEKAKEILDSIKIDKMRENKESMYRAANKEVIKEIDEIQLRLQKYGIDITDVKDEQKDMAEIIIGKVKQEYISRKTREGENKNTIISQVNKIDEFVTKSQQTRRRVVEELMTMMQDALRNDYIDTTKKKWEEIEARQDLSAEERYSLKKQAMGFSEKANNIMYGKRGLKVLNYTEFVQYAKKEYQTGILPKGTAKLIERTTKAIMKTGIIINKFYDPAVLENIGNQELIDLMHQRDINDEEDKQYKKKIGIIKEKTKKCKRARKLKNRKFTSKKTKQKIERKSLYRKIYRYTQAQDERFARTCEDIYYAIPYTVKSNIKKALDSNYKVGEYLPEGENQSINKTKKELAKRFGNPPINPKELEAYIQEKIDDERKNIESKVAMQMCIDYIAGKTDPGIKDLLIKTGTVSKKKFEREDKPNKTGNRLVQQLSMNLAKEDRAQK